MAVVYILYSNKKNKFYVGSCIDLQKRLEQHKEKSFGKSFTALQADDWELFFEINNLGEKQARLIEDHIKRMKSSTYIKNLKNFPEISINLIERYGSAGSSR